jgi:ABC-type Mn2+/Zn2+ transport system ATPase subunit
VTGADAGPATLLVQGVTVELGGVRVLNDVSFQAGPGALIGVVGPNGAGKSTLFNAITGVVPLQAGLVRIHGRPSEDARGALAYIPQQERVNWRFPVTAWDVVMLGRARKAGWLRRPGRHDRDWVRGCLERVGMWNRHASMMADLSGGQRQRVFVGRALAQEADLLLLDEAFSGVDVASQEALVSTLHELRDEGKTILLVTHDLTGLARRVDAVLCLNSHVCAYGPPESAFTPAVLEELYGAHGASYGNNQGGHSGHAS